MKLEKWTCDFNGCDELAQWYRRSKGQIVKLCTKHEALLARQHWGKRVDYSELSEEDMRRLKTKVYRDEYKKEHPFDVRTEWVEDGWKVRVSDIQTKEWRYFVINKLDLEKLQDNHSKLERKGFDPKPTIEDYIKGLKYGVNSKD
jgi:hypothetical protein